MEAGSRQSTGVHAYVPALAGVLSAGLGLLLMSALLVVAAARSLGPVPAGFRRRATLRFFDLLPALFTAQLVVFVGQETIESLVVGGANLPSVVDVLYWGALGQLPGAAIAAARMAPVAAGGGVDDPPRRSDGRSSRACCTCSRTRIPAGACFGRLLASTFPSAFRMRLPPLRSLL